MGTVWTMGELLVEIMRPEAGIPLDRIDTFRGPFPSGAPAIFIDAAARLGHEAGIIGAVGDDAFGRCLVDRLRSDDVNCSYIQKLRGSTAVAFVAYKEDGDRNFIFHVDGTPAVRAEFPRGSSTIRADFFHVMGCSLMANEKFRKAILKTMNFFADRGARVSFDPNIREELLGRRSLEEVAGPVLARTSVLMPGRAEFALLTGMQDEDRSAERLFERTKIEVIVVKHGKDGAVIHTRGGRIEVPASPVTEVDPTGAGDCFDAGFLCGYMENRPLEECGKLAALVGAANAAAFGPMEGKLGVASAKGVTEKEARRQAM